MILDSSIMTQSKIDDLFSLSSTRSGKRSRITTNDRDEFDDLFETSSLPKRRCTNNNTKPIKDVFDFHDEIPLKSPKKKILMEPSKIKRNISDDDETKAFDEIFNNNDTRKKLRRQIKQEESTDLLDMFKTRSNTNIPQIVDDFKIPIPPKNSTTQKKVKMFFDDSDLKSIREEVNQQNDIVRLYSWKIIENL